LHSGVAEGQPCSCCAAESTERVPLSDALVQLTMARFLGELM
jgi:hypothetical protein